MPQPFFRGIPIIVAEEFPKRIYLASRSPRRQELLRQIGVSFVQISADIDESVVPGESPRDYVERMATEKAQAGLDSLAELSGDVEQLPLLAADTSVVVSGDILGKPRDCEDSRRMLRMLSDNTHQVITSVAVTLADDLRVATSISDVTFAALDDDWIDHYWLTGEPQDKAGSYGVQGIAASVIKTISGSYYGVMGLPLYETTQLLKHFMPCSDRPLTENRGIVGRQRSE